MGGKIRLYHGIGFLGMNTPSSPFPSVFITQTSSDPASGEDMLAERMRETYLRGPHRPFPLVDNARDADIVVFWEPYQASEVTLAPKLRREALAVGDPDKVFVVSGEDRPAGFLPGVYTGTPLVGWDRHRFRSGPYCYTMNPLIAEAAQKRDEVPRLLYSFVGAATADVRKSIFDQLKTQGHCVIRETGNMQYTTEVEDPAKRSGQNDYLQTMLDSAFVRAAADIRATGFLKQCSLAGCRSFSAMTGWRHKGRPGVIFRSASLRGISGGSMKSCARFRRKARRWDGRPARNGSRGSNPTSFPCAS
jgi:hypothetical protein